MLISVLDLAAVLAVAAIGAGLLGTDAIPLRAGVVGAVAIGGVIGFWLLRSTRSIGPLDALRELEALQPAREAPLALLGELLVLRFAFIATFILLGRAVLGAFEITAPPAAVAFGIAFASLVAVLPIAVSGIGTVQWAFAFAFGAFGGEAAAVAASVAMSLGLVLLRGGMGLGFAREFTREAFVAARSGGHGGSERADE